MNISQHSLSFLTGLLAWLLLMPYIVWSNRAILTLSFFFLVIAYLLYLYKDNFLVERKSLFLVSLWFVCSLFLLQPGMPNGTSYTGYFFLLSTLGIFLILPERLKISSYYQFKLIFTVSLLPGMFYWILHTVGINIDFAIIGQIADDQMLNPQKSETGTFYYLLPGSVILNYTLDYPLFRLCGMFDEPGIVGTISALLLAADRVDLSKPTNLLLLLAGIMSLSLAFVVILTIYAVLVYLSLIHI